MVIENSGVKRIRSWTGWAKRTASDDCDGSLWRGRRWAGWREQCAPVEGIGRVVGWGDGRGGSQVRVRDGQMPGRLRRVSGQSWRWMGGQLKRSGGEGTQGGRERRWNDR